MDQKEFLKQLKDQFPYPPTPGQDSLLYAFSRFTYSSQPRCTLLLKGYAGTGKTTSVAAYVKTLKGLNQRVVLLAPTGRAAKVLALYSAEQALTIHKKIYAPRTNSGGQRGYVLAPNLHKHTVFLVDEASMIGEQSGMQGEGAFEYRDLLKDLITYVFNGVNCRLVLIGDTAQLPPVGTDESPALNEDLLRSRHDLTIATIELKEVVRQEMDSGILFNATKLREAIALKDVGFPRLYPENFPDVKLIQGSDLQEALEELNGKYGRHGVMVITRSNKRANLFNQQIRARIEWFEDELNAGDLLMVVKNNYHWFEQFTDAPSSFIANGDSVEVLKIVREQELYGHHFADVEIRLLDYPNFPSFEVKIMMDTLHLETPSLSTAQNKALYHAVAEDYLDLGDRKKIHKAVMSDSFYNALQVKFAYAVTCHKSQGGQWPAVVVDQGYLTEEMLDVGLLRWFYTALTRAQSELYLLNFHPGFFGEEDEQE
jgi:exodeoxyribonuclease V